MGRLKAFGKRKYKGNPHIRKLPVVNNVSLCESGDRLSSNVLEVNVPNDIAICSPCLDLKYPNEESRPHGGRNKQKV